MAAQKASNKQLPAGRSREDFVEFRTKRDAGLNAPRLLFQSVQVNVDAGGHPRTHAWTPPRAPSARRHGLAGRETWHRACNRGLWMQRSPITPSSSATLSTPAGFSGPGLFASRRSRPVFDTLKFLAYLLRHGLSCTYRALLRLLGEREEVRLREIGLAGEEVLVTRDENTTRAVLTQPRAFERAPMDDYQPLGTRCMLGAGSGRDWLRYRRMFTPYFTTGYRADLPALEAIVTERVATWRNRGRVDLLRELFKLVVQIRGQVFFQHDFGCFEDDDETFADLVRQLFEPPLFVFDRDPEGLAPRFRARIRAALDEAHAPGSLGHSCRTLRARGELSDEEAVQNAALFVLAQAPTFAVFWILYRAAKLGRCAELGRDRVELLRAIKEELRVHPPVTRLLTRVATRELSDLDEPLRPGTKVVMAPLFTHHSPRLWDQPEEYRPARWAVDSEDASELLDAKREDEGRPRCPHMHARADARSSLRYMPFGAGQHRCLGRRFAVEEITIISETILRHVELEVIDDGDLLARPLAEQIALNPYAAPVHDVSLRVRGRDTQTASN